MEKLNQSGFDTIFLKARTYKSWQQKPISDELIKQLYDTLKWGPTSANCCPARFVFIKSKEARERLLPLLAKGNLEKTATAACTVIIAEDMEFYKKFPKLAPHAPKSGDSFVGKTDFITETAFRNGSLQGAYLMIAARALGLDCGPMSGFDNAKVDDEFLKGTTWKSNFLCNLGYGDVAGLFPRAPRLDFEESCQLI